MSRRRHTTVYTDLSSPTAQVTGASHASHTCLHYFTLSLGEAHRKGSQHGLHLGAWIQEDLGSEDESVKWITQHRSQPPGGKITGDEGLPCLRLLKGTSLDKPGLASIHVSGGQGSRVSHQALLSWGPAGLLS